MTCTFCRLAHDIAASTASSVPPAALRAFAMTSAAFGATPRYTVPSPAMVPATWVPCPTSSVSPAPLKSDLATT